jgi:DnaJ-class molecular chaperone
MLQNMAQQALGKDDCRYCRGTGVIEAGAMTPYECTSCNGTGRRGNPVLGFTVLLLSVVSTIVPVVWFFCRGH